MKLAIAARILALPLAAVSETTLNVLVQEKKLELEKMLFPMHQRADGWPYRALGKRQAGRREVMFSKLLPKKTSRRLINQQSTKEGVKFCNPFSNDPDVGILSCGSESVCRSNEFSLLGGRCELKYNDSLRWRNTLTRNEEVDIPKNANKVPPRVDMDIVECDPTGMPDIGILLCDVGQDCIANAASSLGGVCMQSSPLRQLYDDGENSNECDYSGYDNSTDSGEIVCTFSHCYNALAQDCRQFCINISYAYSYNNTIRSKSRICYDILSFPKNVSETFCYEVDFDAKKCNVTVDDQQCNSCIVEQGLNYSFYFFDCLNIGTEGGFEKKNDDTYFQALLPQSKDCFYPPTAQECILCKDKNIPTLDSSKSFPIGGLVGNFTCRDLFDLAYKQVTIGAEYCAQVSEAAARECCVPFCDLCGPDNYIPTNNYSRELNVTVGYLGNTCRHLAWHAYTIPTISESYCRSAAEAARAACCVPYVLESCDICNGPLVNPNATVSYDGNNFTCFTFAKKWNASVCAAAAPLVASTCCSSPDAAAQGIYPPSNAPGSLTLFSSWGILSIVCFQTAAVLFWMT